jgi:hypothetical protein
MLDVTQYVTGHVTRSRIRKTPYFTTTFTSKYFDAN